MLNKIFTKTYNESNSRDVIYGIYAELFLAWFINFHMGGKNNTSDNKMCIDS